MSQHFRSLTLEGGGRVQTILSRRLYLAIVIGYQRLTRGDFQASAQASTYIGWLTTYWRCLPSRTQIRTWFTAPANVDDDESPQAIDVHAFRRPRLANAESRLEMWAGSTAAVMLVA